jgi:hypothetical protein
MFTGVSVENTAVIFISDCHGTLVATEQTTRRNMSHFARLLTSPIVLCRHGSVPQELWLSVAVRHTLKLTADQCTLNLLVLKQNLNILIIFMSDAWVRVQRSFSPY